MIVDLSALSAKVGHAWCGEEQRGFAEGNSFAQRLPSGVKKTPPLTAARAQRRCYSGRLCTSEAIIQATSADHVGEPKACDDMKKPIPLLFFFHSTRSTPVRV